jgi:hypothetical protein
VASEETPASEVQLEAMRLAELMVHRNTWRWEGSYVSPNWAFHYLVSQRSEGFTQTDARFAVNSIDVDWNLFASRMIQQLMNCCCRNRWPMTREDLINNLTWNDFSQESINHALVHNGYDREDWYARAVTEVAIIKGWWGNPEGDWVRNQIVSSISWGRYTQSQVNHALAENGFEPVTDWSLQAVEQMRNMYRWDGLSREGILHRMMQRGFTNAQINYAAYEVLIDADWNEQAVRMVRNRIQWLWGSRQQIIDNLKSEGFTESQIAYATEFLDSHDIDWYAQVVSTLSSEIDSTWFVESGRSRRSLIDNIRWWGFTTSQVNHAIEYLDSRNVDWNAQAASAAENTMNQIWIRENGISHAGLIRRLSEDWMGFTYEQAVFGANSVGLETEAQWNAQAVIFANRSMTCCCFSNTSEDNAENRRSSLINRLRSEGFTQDQTNHVLNVTTGLTPVDCWQTLANQRAVEISSWGWHRNQIIRSLISSGFTQSQIDTTLVVIGESAVGDWDAFAVEMAEELIENGSGFAPRSLTWELRWFGFSRPQAEAAVAAVEGKDVDWNAQAEKRVDSTMSWGWWTPSRQGAIDSLMSDGFTPEQAVHAVSDVDDEFWLDNAILSAAQVSRELSSDPTKVPSEGLITSIMIEEHRFTLEQAEAAMREENSSRTREIQAEREVKSRLNSTWNQGMSRSALFRDLTSEWMAFTPEQAEKALPAETDPVWYDQAAKKFQTYVSWGNIGARPMFIRNLTNEWEGFTLSQAEAAVPPATEPIWNDLAVSFVNNRMDLSFEWNSGWSRSALFRDLTSEWTGFTPSQANEALPVETDPVWNAQALRRASHTIGCCCFPVDSTERHNRLLSNLLSSEFTQEQIDHVLTVTDGFTPIGDWQALANQRAVGMTGWQRDDIIRNLRQSGFTQPQVDLALTHISLTPVTDWQAFADQRAQELITTGQGYAPRNLTRELTWFGFTPAQAEAAVGKLSGVDWNAQATRRFESLELAGNTGSRQWFIDILMNDGFTLAQSEQAVHVANNKFWYDNAVLRAAQLRRDLTTPTDTLIISTMTQERFTQSQAEHGIANIARARYIQAERQAQQRLNSSHGVSRAALISELTNEWSGFTQSQAEQAVPAADSPIWNAQAARAFESMLSWSSATNRQWFIDQLTSESYGFTPAQAEQAVPSTDASLWYDMATAAAQRRLVLVEGSYGVSRTALLRELTEWSGFTQSQAEHAVPAANDTIWNAQAARSAERYLADNPWILEWSWQSPLELLTQYLTSEWTGFTPAQAQHATDTVLGPLGLTSFGFTADEETATAAVEDELELEDASHDEDDLELAA